MSIAIVQKGTGSGSHGTSTSFNMSATGVTAGNTIIDTVQHEDTGGTNPTISVSDGQGTYTLDAPEYRGNQNFSGVFSLFNANSGTHSITAAASSGTGANSEWGMDWMEVSGLGTTDSIDQTSGASQNPGTTPTTGTTSSLAQGSELVVCVMGGNGGSIIGGTYPPTGGNNSPYISIYNNLNGSGSTWPCDMDYQINTSSTTGVSASWGTLSNSQMNTAAIATYRAATASAAFRKTLSPLGTRIGSRQIQL